MNAFRSAGNWVANKTKGSAHSASKEANKQYVGFLVEELDTPTDCMNHRVAKDPNVKTSTRIRAAGDAMKDKVHEQNYNRQADVNRHAAKHNY